MPKNINCDRSVEMLVSNDIHVPFVLVLTLKEKNVQQPLELSSTQLGCGARGGGSKGDTASHRLRAS
jgi:hypothetical protein